MKKKLVSSLLIALILISSLLGSVKTADAALPDAVIKLSKPLLARLITLVVAGLNIESVTSATDIAGRYYEAGITAPDWDAEGNLTIDIQAIDNARNWLDATYPALPAVISVEGGQAYIGTVLPAIEPYTKSHSVRTLAANQDFSETGLYKINIIDFTSITSWVNHEIYDDNGPEPPVVLPPVPSDDYENYVISSTFSTLNAIYQPGVRLTKYKSIEGVAPSAYVYSPTSLRITPESYVKTYYLRISDNTWVSQFYSNTYSLSSSFDGEIYGASGDVYATSALTDKLFPYSTTPTADYNDAAISIDTADTSDFYTMTLSTNSGWANWGSPQGSSVMSWMHDEYIGFKTQMRINVSSNPSLTAPGKQDLSIWPSFYDLSYGWSEHDDYPIYTFDGTDAKNINITVDASPMGSIQALMEYNTTYNKSDLIIGDKSLVPVITGEPTNWNQINDIVENPVDPLDPPPEEPTEELGLLTNILSLFSNLLTWLQSLPSLMSEAMGTKLMALFIPLDMTPIQNDFTEVNEAFANAFPFSIAADLNGLFFPPDGGLQYPCIGYTMTDPDQVSRYHVVFDFGDIPSGHRAMSDQLRHILTLGLWLGFAVGLLSLALKRGGKIS